MAAGLGWPPGIAAHGQRFVIQRPAQSIGCRPGFEEHNLPAGGNVRIERNNRPVTRIGNPRCGVAFVRRRDQRCFRPAQKPLATRRFHVAGKGDSCDNQIRLARRLKSGNSPLQIIHHLPPHRRGASHAGDVAHGFAVEVSHPHAHAVAAGKADAPVVAHVLAGARFHGAPIGRGKRAVEAEGDAARAAVGENVRHDVGRRTAHDSSHLPCRCIGTEAGRRPPAAIGQRAIRVRLLQQAHFRRTQGQRIAVKIGGFGKRLVAQGLEPRVEGLHACQHQRAHCGDVERAGQRRTQTHRALEVVIVVLRNVEPGGGGKIDRRIVQNRSRRQQPAFDGEAVEKRLQRRARLPWRAHAVNIACTGGHAAVAHVSEHVAAGVVHDQHRAVAHLLAGE